MILILVGISLLATNACALLTERRVVRLERRVERLMRGDNTP
jgi:hypothetical protein